MAQELEQRPVPGRVFLSYRVSADAKLVERIYDKLRALHVDVWLDTKCLTPGQPWGEGFADGLLSSDVFVPFLSRAALAPFASLQLDSSCDNVLLEYRMALELKERGLLRAVHPVFVGEPMDTSIGRGYGDFFAGGGLPHVADTRVEAVEAKATEHLRRASQGSGGAVAEADCSVSRTLKAICDHQGAFLRGAPKADAVEKVVSALVRVVNETTCAPTMLMRSPAVSSEAVMSALVTTLMGSPAVSSEALIAPVVPSPVDTSGVDGEAPERILTSKLADIPPQVPRLHASEVKRPEILRKLKKHVLGAGFSATALTAPRRTGNTTAAKGMGGVGKSTAAAMLVHDRKVLSTFQKICWVSVGQEPDLLKLQDVLMMQLTGEPLPETKRSDAQLALTAIKAASKDLRVLLVLDDVWRKEDATGLNFVHSHSERSAVVITTRERELLEGTAEVSCDVLSEDESLELLLKAGKCDHLLSNAPPQVTAVKLCDRLPLALGVAGSMIKELGSKWEEKLVPRLEAEMHETVEKMVVTASLSAMPDDLRAGVEGVFTLFALFAEDAKVPTTAIEALAPLLLKIMQRADKGVELAAATEVVPACEPEPQDSAQSLMCWGLCGLPWRRKYLPINQADVDHQPATSKEDLLLPNVRPYLEKLLGAHILLGSMDSFSAHDLVREVMIHRAGGRRLREMQREALPLLLAASSKDEDVWGYVSAHLFAHVRQAQCPDSDLHMDEVLMSLLCHESAEVRKQVVLGITVEEVRAAADECDRLRDHLKTAQLLWAACAVRGSGAGLEAKRAWSSLKQLEEAGGGSAASRALELSVLNALFITTSGGVQFGSEDHKAVLERMKELSNSRASEPKMRSREAMDLEFSLGCAVMVEAFCLEGTAPESVDIEGTAIYSGEMTDVTLLDAFGRWSDCEKHMLRAANAAPDATTETAMWSFHAGSQGWGARMHRLPCFNPEVAFGEGGERLRNTITRYEHDAVHRIAKQVGNHTDVFMLGLEPLYLLLWWGDLSAMRAGVEKALYAHRRVLERVQHGAAPADGFGYESVISTFLTNALVTAGDMKGLGEFMKHSMSGAALTDENVRAGVAAYWTSGFGGWQSADGHCYTTEATWLLVQRGLAALVEDNTDASRIALQEWLPSAAELLRITELEVAWRSNPWSANHPAVLVARLYGERLLKWGTVILVVEGVLRIEQFNSMLRAEAYRLLGRARHALGEYAEAVAAAERAVAEATRAGYVWLEVLSLCDLLRWCGAREKEGVWARLACVAERLTASVEEVAAALGESGCAVLNAEERRRLISLVRDRE